MLTPRLALRQYNPEKNNDEDEPDAESEDPYLADEQDRFERKELEANTKGQY